MEIAALTSDPQSVLPEVAAELIQWRKEAVEGRQASGIEDKWQYAEDAYNSQDEATRSRRKVLKPSTKDGGFIAPVAQSSWKRSIAYLNITRPYVDASAARTADMLFPTDERNWEIKPTPKADVEDMLKYADMLPDEALPDLMDYVAMSAEQAISSVADAQRQIDDWLTECDWNSVGRKLLLDAARVGTGVVKGPVPMSRKGRIQPGSKTVKVQNCFPDPNCGSDIQNGEYFIERELITARKFRKKQKMEVNGWLPASVKSCLKEGPKSYKGDLLKENGKPKKQYELWHVQAEIKAEALAECGCSIDDDSGPHIFAQLTLCNDFIVRVSIVPLQENFTYCMMPWQEREDSWAGIGVGEQLETPQRGLNAGIRNLFDNAALSSLPQIVYWKNILTPVNGRFELEPGKVWEITDEEVSINDVKNAIMTIEIPSKQSELMEIIALMRDLAQDTTGMPLIMQGQGSSGAVGSDQLQTNNASTVLRRLAKDFDSKVTDPHIDAYYDWIKEFDIMEVPEAVVESRGSSVLVERDIQAQALIQMLQMAKDPAYGVDPKLAMIEWQKSQKFDPRKIALSPEREKELTAAMQQPDEKAQAQITAAQLRNQTLSEQTQVEAETDRIELKLKQQSEQLNRQHDQTMLNLEYRFKLVDYAMKNQIDLQSAMDQLKGVEVPKMMAEQAMQAGAEVGKAQPKAEEQANA